MRREATYLAELTGLCALVVAQPVFEILQAAPEELVLRGAGRLELVVLALVLVAIPPFVVWCAEATVGLIRPAARPVVHAVTLAALTGLLAVEVVKRSTGPRPGILLPIGLAVAVAVT